MTKASHLISSKETGSNIPNILENNSDLFDDEISLNDLIISTNILLSTRKTTLSIPLLTKEQNEYSLGNKSADDWYSYCNKNVDNKVS